ncbi:type II toxin-antitoxin system VapC family toxin [Muribacter muris]|uniref:Ribonuclease VapC n=1 Tax=Muribacter muris TaxID=67855 RepID=A0A4Y9K848_9PAST|nr:type II toxin-antitoxin system VapC family toxin [Muribacter muris]MBF0783879.1 type II toxin-antitoxin system VapC family toxin [Muribacter muris]MBF0826377.1 type II toxin-antitoxin system VapC family toxin [Muribacter muris]TFV13280.1 type II toxin-antitoxin system VapC family toxin [Muribacter muris]
MKYLLDTNAVIALLNRQPQFIEKLTQYKPADFVLSSIVLFELCFGAEKSQRKAENLAKLDKLPFEIVPFTAQDARIAGKIRAELALQGQPIGAYDVQIAAQAISRHLTLITHNIKEFKRVDSLNYEDWL